MSGSILQKKAHQAQQRAESKVFIEIRRRISETKATITFVKFN